MPDFEHLQNLLLSKAPLYRSSDLEAKPVLPPASPGVYAWLFSRIPGSVPTMGCLVRDGAVLLYVGISPKNPEAGRPSGAESGITSGAMLKVQHFGSPWTACWNPNLARFFGVLVQANAGQFGDTGRKLTEWMAENASVSSGRGEQSGRARRASHSDAGAAPEFGPKRPRSLPRPTVGTANEGQGPGAAPACLGVAWLNSASKHHDLRPGFCRPTISVKAALPLEQCALPEECPAEFARRGP